MNGFQERVGGRFLELKGDFDKIQVDLQGALTTIHDEVQTVNTKSETAAVDLQKIRTGCEDLWQKCDTTFR